MRFEGKDFMITFWQQENSKLSHYNPSDLDISKHTWIDARNVTREDIRVLEEEYHIEQEHILDILDQDELARIEKTDDYTLIIIRLPVFDSEADIRYYTIPLGIILYPDYIITICWTDCEVIKDIAANRLREIRLADFPAFIMCIMSRADTLFLRYLKEINRRAASIQSELQHAVKNRELIHLMNLQKSLVFFTTSLKSNKLLIDKISRTKILPLDEDDRDWLDDVEIDHRQAIEMADTYSDILDGIAETFDSVINNNLNQVMKRLTVISLILMVPTFITSFFGMNVPLPFANTGYLGAIILLLCCIATSVFAGFFLRDKPDPDVAKERRKKPRKKR